MSVWDHDVLDLAAEARDTFGREVTLLFADYAAFNQATGETAKTTAALTVRAVRREMASDTDRGGKRLLTVIYDFVRADLGGRTINQRTQITDGDQRFLVVAADHEADETMVRVTARRTA